MKKVLFIFSLLFYFLVHQSFAQDTLSHVTSQQLSVAILNKIDHEISLSEEQKEDVLALLSERSKQIDQIKAKGKSSGLTKSSLREVNKDAYAKLQKVLSQEQFNRLQALREETQKQKANYTEEQVYLSNQDVVLDF